MDDLFKEISNPREKKLIGDAQDLLKTLEDQCVKGKIILESHSMKNEKLINNIKDYFSEYRRKNDRLKRNYDVFNRAVEDGSVVKRLNDLNFEDLFDVPPEGSKMPSWFSEFKREEFQVLQENLEILAKKLYKARVSEELLNEREIVSTDIQELIDELKIDEQSSDWVVPKEKLVKIENQIVKLNQFDMLIPQIMAEILNRASSSARALYNQFLDFRRNAMSLHKAASSYTAENDRSLRAEFNNINFADSQALRAKRYNVLIRNAELATIQEGRTLNEKILFFLTDYFHERCNYYKTMHSQQAVSDANSALPYNEKYVMKANTSGITQHDTTAPMSTGVYVFKSNFFEALIPPGTSLSPESLNYDAVKMMTSEFRGFRNTVFDRFQRLFLSIQITTNNWILCEIKNHPEKEILVYDSDLRFFAGYHERVCAVLRAYIAAEIRNKTDLTLEESQQTAANYTGRTVSSPQNNLPQDNAIYFAKNLQISAGGNAVHPGSYRLDNINAFRLELFTFFVRIGINVDRPLPFEILL